MMVTIHEKFEDQEELIRRNKKEYMDKYREENRHRFRKYQKRYYQTKREEINDKRARTDPKDRKCQWCGEDISHIRPRHIRFCNDRHSRLYANERRKRWYRENQSKKARDLKEAQKKQRINH